MTEESSYNSLQYLIKLGKKKPGNESSGSSRIFNASASVSLLSKKWELVMEELDQLFHLFILLCYTLRVSPIHKGVHMPFKISSL